MKKIKSVKKKQKRSIKTKSKKIIILEHKKRFEEVKENKQTPIDLEEDEEDDENDGKILNGVFVEVYFGRHI